MIAFWKRLKERFSLDPSGEFRRIVGKPLEKGLRGPVTIPTYDRERKGGPTFFLEGGTPVFVLEQDEQEEGDTSVPLLRVLHDEGIFWVHERYVTDGEDFEDYYEM